MAKYLDPRTDIVFKKIFSQHIPLLKSFLNAVLPLEPGREIVELVSLPPEQVPLIPILKRTIADVRCKDNYGRYSIVEMQMEWTEVFRQRLLFGAGQSLISQLEKGEHYRLIQPVYGLGIISAEFDPDHHSWYHHYKLIQLEKAQRNIIETIEHLQLIFIELPKFPVDTIDEGKKLRTLWLRFLREINQHTQEVSSDLLAVPEIAEAVHLAEQAAYSEDELYLYQRCWDDVRTVQTLIDGRYQEGMIEGKAAQSQAIAKSLVARGVSLEIVMEATGLSEKEIQGLLLVEAEDSVVIHPSFIGFNATEEISNI